MEESGSVQSPADEPPPSRRNRLPIWQGVGEEEWNDWRWQLRHRLTTLEQLQQLLQLTPQEEWGIQAANRMRLAITPHFASLLDPEDPNCPLRRQVVPTVRELDRSISDLADPLNEDGQSPVPGLVHRYPDRVLLMTTDQCASYCRHCTRRRMVGARLWQMGRAQMEQAVAYIDQTPAVRDVIISGGDPLLLGDQVLERLVRSLRDIPHVEILRLHTRTPVFLPQRITPELVAMLRRYHPLYINIHFNHPREITPETERACRMLADAGIPLGSQTVLLAGINDCPNVMKALMRRLLQIRVRPYYIFQCDLSDGIGHFRTPVSTGIAVMEGLRGHTSGLAVPTFVVDAPGGGGKIPVGPQYVLSQSAEGVVLRNYEGNLAAYPQPIAYSEHRPKECLYCRTAAARGEGQGVAELLADQLPKLRTPSEAECCSEMPVAVREEALAR
jgi:lysine 2,3-aminomutase